MTTLEETRELKESFKIKFEGDQNQIDANTFVNYLIHFSTIIQEINREVAPERKISIKIKATEKGSFVIDAELQSILEQVVLILSDKSVDYLSNLFGVYQGLILLKQALQGKKPDAVKKEGTSVTIVINGGNVTVSDTAYNIYSTNRVVDQALTKQFETLEEDENIDEVDISNSRGQTILSVPREDFSDLARPNEIFEAGVRREVRRAMLSIVKPSFDPKLKSEFYYLGIRISALIKDKKFHESVNRGQAFAKGDALEVQLQVNIAFDPSVNTEVIRGYEVVEVIRHVKRDDSSQLQLDLNSH